MMPNGALITRPGTTLSRRLTEGTEIWTNIKLGALIVAISDVVLTVILLTAIKTGWWALPVLGLVTGFLVGFFVLLFASRLKVELSDRLVLVLGNLWGAGCVLGFIVGYFGRVRVDPAINALNEQIMALLFFEWWWYGIGAVLFVAFGLVVRNWRAMAIFGVVELFACLFLAADWAEYERIWDVLSWIALAYLWPIAGVGIVLILRLFQEMMLPNLEFTLAPFSMDEWRQVGAWGVLAPRLFGSHDDEPQVIENVDEINVNLTVQPDGRSKPQVKRLPKLPGGPEAKDFYRAVHRGESFTVRTAVKYKVGRGTFNDKLRDGFVKRGLAVWKNSRHRNLGVNLKPEGFLLIEHLALVGTTPTPPLSAGTRLETH